MRKKLGVIILSAMLVMFFAVPAMANISGSAHDFTTSSYTNLESYTNSSGGACAACHTPHNADQDTVASEGILFGRTFNQDETTSYSASASNYETPNHSVTEMCMSCHDGTISPLQSVSGVNGNDTSWSNTSANLGYDMNDDHPVDVDYTTYDTADDKYGLVSPSSGTVGTAGLPLYSNFVTCGSCHDPHDDDNGKFLEVDPSSTDLCMQCHANK